MVALIKSFQGDDNGGAIMPYVAPTPPRSQTDRIDLRALAAIFRRRVGIFLTVLVAVIVTALVLTTLQVPRYTATASIALDVKQDQITPVGQTDRSLPSTVPSDAYVDTQISVIGSQTMAMKVVDRLGLDHRRQFTRREPATGLRGWLSPDAGGPIEPAVARAAALRYLLGNVTGRRVGETYALDIVAESEDPREAADIANAYAIEYTQGALREHRAANERNLRFLSGRLREVQADAQAATNAVQRYRNSNGLLTSTTASLNEQEISSYNQAVASAQAQSAEDEARLVTARTQLRGGSTGGDIGEALGSPVISNMRGTQSATATRLAELTTRYGSAHPEVRQARSQLAEVNGQIQAEIGRIISNLDAKRRVSAQRLSSLRSSLGSAQGGLAVRNEALPGLNDLEKRAATSEALYESYLNRYKELSAREGTEQADASVLTPALTPTRASSPNVLLNLILGIVLGIGLGIAVAFVTEMGFAGITTGDDIEQRLGVRYLGSIPLLGSVMRRGKQPPVMAILNDPRSAFAESFRSLRASLQFAQAGPARVIAVASALPQEGKTTTAICLGRSMAMAGERVVLVDCDLRQHGVSRFLRREHDAPGLTEVLRGEATLEQAIIVDESTSMAVLPVSTRGDLDAELVTGEQMDRLLDDLRSLYDVIVIDTAPVLPIADARLVLGKADTTVFVVRWRKTPDHAIRAAFRMLPASHVALAGVVLTRVDMRKQARFGYGDETFYYPAYKNYYA